MYDAAVQRRKKHHFSDKVYDGQFLVVYLTICAANHGRWLEDPDLAVLARDEILKLHRDHPIIGFCIMPDHVHLLICNAGSTLGRITNAFKGCVSRRVRQIRPDLEVWQPGYWDHIVRKEEGLYTVLKYILLNPVRAGLVQDWWDHEWLGSPLIGDVGPEFFIRASPEDIVWRDLLRIED